MPIFKDLIDKNIIQCGKGVLQSKYGECVTTVYDLTNQGTVIAHRRVTVNEERLLKSTGLTKINFYNDEPLSSYTKIYNTELELEILKLKRKLLSDTNPIPIPVGMAAHANGFFLTPDEFEELGQITTEISLEELKSKFPERLRIKPVKYWENETPKSVRDAQHQKPPTPEVDYGAGIITKYHDGGSWRPLCRHPYNEKHSQYDIPCSQHVPDCMCPIHRSKTFWRRLTDSARIDRNAHMKNDQNYMKSVVGLSSEEYKGFLMGDFRETFSGILSDQVLGKTYSELRNDSFVIDEIFPRCQGKHWKDPAEIAIFLAKVFNYRNTQLLLHNNVEARRHGVDPKKYGMLINGSKGGIVYAGTKENFDEIEPSREAVSYMLKFVHNFIEKEPKLEIRL